MKVILVSINEYTRQLKQELMKKQVDVELFPSFHYATPKNVLRTFILKNKGYNIIHFGWLYAFLSDNLMKFYVKFAKKLDYKLIYQIHDIQPHEKKFGGKKKIEWWYRHMDHLFLHYPSSLDRIKNELGIDITSSQFPDYTIMFHPNWGDRYKNQISQREARKKLGIAQNKRVLLSFGLIKQYKGMEIFADVMEKLQKINGSYFGMVAGIPHDLKVVKYLEKKSHKLENFVVVPKKIPNDDVQIYMNAADCIILPYTMTNLTSSGVLNLAYTFHKPVITTWYPSLEDIVTEDRGLFIKNPCDLESIIERIEKLFSMDYENMGENAYNFIKTLTWEKLTKLMIKGYMEVLKEW